MVLKYLSLFSGIGGFELALGPNTKCVAFAEIDKHALQVYTSHFPLHYNLGNVSTIKRKDIIGLGKIDLIVAGFPCNNLSSANVKSRTGLDGEKSGLFWNLINIIKWARSINPDLQICIENNASMAHKWRDLITQELSKALKKTVFCNYIDSSVMMVQRRRRYFWTLVSIPMYIGPKLQTMKDVLIPVHQARKYEVSKQLIEYKNKSPEMFTGNGFIVVGDKGCYTKQKSPKTRWCLNSTSQDDFITCLSTRSHDNTLLDYRLCKEKDYFVPRTLAKLELERLSGFPDGYSDMLMSKTATEKVFGMTVIVPVVQYVLIKSNIIGCALKNVIL
jgi:DNA-cytosine methyltransferase